MRLAVALVTIGMFATTPACAQATNSAAAQTPVAAAIPAKPADTAPKVVCKRVPIVGSNVGTERVCTVRGDSQKSSDGQARPPEDAQGRNGSSSGN